jgi:hypothetical protein
MSASPGVGRMEAFVPIRSIACSSTDTFEPQYAIPTLGQFFYHLFAATVKNAENHPTVDKSMIGVIQSHFPASVNTLFDILRACNSCLNLDKVINNSDDYFKLYAIHIMLEGLDRKGVFPDWEVLQATVLSEFEDAQCVVSEQIITEFNEFFNLQTEERTVLMYLTTNPECDTSDPSFRIRSEIRRRKTHLIYYNKTQLQLGERYQAQIANLEKQIVDLRKAHENLEGDTAKYSSEMYAEIEDLEAQLQPKRQLDDSSV